MLTFRVPFDELTSALCVCEDYDFVSWYEDETSYTQKIDHQGFPVASHFFVEVYVKDDSLLDKLGDFFVKRSPLPVANLNNLDIEKKVGEFWINPSFCVSKGIYVKAGTAFGSGEHQTTSLCLEAISDLNTSPEMILDLGCGSGILAIAASKKWPKAKIDASDCDSESVYVARQNAQRNKSAVSVYESFGFSNQSIKNQYDLIVANILAKPLIHLAKEMKVYAKETVILSGLLDQQKDLVLHAYRLQGFFIQKIYQKNEWVALVLKLKR
jgi:ribosomal protein L11 methylase PrmA